MYLLNKNTTVFLSFLFKIIKFIDILLFYKALILNELEFIFLNYDLLIMSHK
jgi:hypothetical protein